MKENQQRRLLAETALDTAVRDMEDMAMQALRDTEAIWYLNAANFYAMKTRDFCKERMEKAQQQLTETEEDLNERDSEVKRLKLQLQESEDKRLKAEHELMKVQHQHATLKLVCPELQVSLVKLV